MVMGNVIFMNIPDYTKTIPRSMCIYVKTTRMNDNSGSIITINRRLNVYRSSMFNIQIISLWNLLCNSKKNPKPRTLWYY